MFPAQRAVTERFEYSQIHMGVKVTFVLYADRADTAEGAARAAYARFAELEQIMSDYRPDSEVMRLCDRAGEGPVKVSPELFTVVQRAVEVSALSEGTFDVTCGPIVKLWREARKTKKLPSPTALSTAREVVGYRYLALDSAASTIDIGRKGVRIDLGGIAKGYACDEALRVLGENGVDRALVQAGGDLAASGAPPGKLGWRVAIQGRPAEDAIWLKNAAMSTSGDSEQFVTIGGRRYSHIVDPRTGYGLVDQVQVTVIAKDGLTSDSLSKALCILGPKAVPLAERYGAKTIFVKR